MKKKIITINDLIKVKEENEKEPDNAFMLDIFFCMSFSIKGIFTV